LALLLLLTDPTLEVAGVSTVFGNAPLEVTDSVTRALEAALARAGIARPPVFRAAAAPRRRSSAAQAAAYAALRDALAADPLTIVALGPLTNLAAALERRPQLQQRVVRLVAVMGRRAGHLFHPAEGRGTGGMLLGHGPVFSDFNFEQDPDAAAAVGALAKAPTDNQRQTS